MENKSHGYRDSSREKSAKCIEFKVVHHYLHIMYCIAIHKQVWILRQLTYNNYWCCANMHFVFPYIHVICFKISCFDKVALIVHAMEVVFYNINHHRDGIQ